MGHQIIKQPDGHYAVWSSVVDAFVITDATAKELEDYYGAQAAEEAEERTRKLIQKLEAGEKPYYQFTMTYEEALALQAEIHPNIEEEI